MTTNLWSANSPASFWRCLPDPPADAWEEAFRKALPTLALSRTPDNIDDLVATILGEGQFGPDHWQISAAKRLYYAVKSILPRAGTVILRRRYSANVRAKFPLRWPIEERFAQFQQENIRQLLSLTDRQSISFINFWPDHCRYAFILTHDIETEKGQRYVCAVADLEERLGFRSSFNFVPERYPLDYRLMDELRRRGFEVGVHGLTHAGDLFISKAEFLRQAASINHYLHALRSTGFSSPLTHRNPEWMQELEIEYDLSFFDTDPYEPNPGGTMSIWPFMIGRFVELPYTLVQDYTLTTILTHHTPALWQQKVDFIEQFCGMALVRSHPDYLLDPLCWNVYEQFLTGMRNRQGYWHALPREVARWWRSRAQIASPEALPNATLGQACVNGQALVITPG